VDRASINLHSDILEDPDFFWEDDEYLSVYQRVAKYLEVRGRLRITTSSSSSSDTPSRLPPPLAAQSSGR
jgi:uncharacterized Rmd1/YagE family protein